MDVGLDAPVLVGHSTGGALATVYATRHPATAVVSVNAPVRLEAFARLLRSLHPQLAGDRFGEAWAMYRDSWQLELLPAGYRSSLGAGNRSDEATARELVLSYHADLLEGALEEGVREREIAQDRLSWIGTPYLTLHSCALDRADETWLRRRLPQAQILVWPVGHHFPHLAHPDRFAALLTGIAATSAASGRDAPT